MKLVLGLDLGVASIGWALLQKNDNNEFERIIDLGSRVFNQLQDGKSGKLENFERRNKRSMRRQRRRKVRRLEELRKLMKNDYKSRNSKKHRRYGNIGKSRRQSSFSLL